MMTGTKMEVSTFVPFASVNVRPLRVLPRHVSVVPLAVTKVSPKSRLSFRHLLNYSLKERPKMMDEAPLSMTAVLGFFPSISSSLLPVTKVAMEYL